MYCFIDNYQRLFFKNNLISDTVPGFGVLTHREVAAEQESDGAVKST